MILFMGHFLIADIEYRGLLTWMRSSARPVVCGVLGVTRVSYHYYLYFWPCNVIRN